MSLGPVLGLITARGGSKRLPGKNLRPLGGLSLIARTVEAARGCARIDRVVISTDDEAIAAEARKYGAEVPFMRPPELAGDEASSIDVVLHALDWLAANQGYRPGAVVLLQPTSPLRTVKHLTQAIEQLERQQPAASVVGVTQARPAAWLYVESASRGLSPLFEKGAVPPLPQGASLVIPNGAIYVAAVDFVRAHRGFVGPGTEAFRMSARDSIDIDTAEDFSLAEALIAR